MKKILVTGATGAQGASVARAILANGQFSVRIFTRNADSPRARELEMKGAELFQGDMFNKEDLLSAMHNCYGVFGVTNFWEHFDRETIIGTNLLDAAKKAAIEHLVFHTLADYSLLSKGQFPVPHCDGKAALQRYAVSLNLPATFVQIAFYYENFLSYFPLQKQPDGSRFFGFPQGDTNLAMVSVEDLGPVVVELFKNSDQFIGKTIGVVAEDEPCSKYASIMSNVCGVPVHYHSVPHHQFAALGFPGASELANMFEVQRLYIPERKADLELTKKLYPAVQSFESWVHQNKERLLSS